MALPGADAQKVEVNIPSDAARERTLCPLHCRVDSKVAINTGLAVHVLSLRNCHSTKL